MDNFLDSKIPFMPSFILIYFGCYLFWTVNYCLIARMDAEHCFRFFTADLCAKLICFLFFILLPTTNIRPELTNQDIWIKLVRFLYRIDEPTNLFPSIHCLTSWFCYIGIRNTRTIPRWYQHLSLVMALAVFVSTLALRQHVLIDVLGGVLLAQATYWISCHSRGYCFYQCFVEKIIGADYNQ